MKTDSVLAELTPREAVLNRNAAELMGRKKIAALNAKGNKLAERGVDLPSRKYQLGTSNVEVDKRPPKGPKAKAGIYEPSPTPKPIFQFQGGSSDVGNERRDLLKEAEETFYGGGQAPPPKPTPTPTPKPRKYQYGTSNVRRAVDMSAPASAGFSGGFTGGFAGSPGSFGGGSTINTNPSAFSRGVNYPFATPVPDLSRANPSTLGRLDISNLIYSPNAGGYLTRSEAENANSWYTKFGQGSGGDPLANRSAARFYGYIGSLPTRAMGTPALNQYYNQFGGGSAPGGPSFNSMLGSQWQGPYQFGVRGPSGYNPGGWTGSDF